MILKETYKRIIAIATLCLFLLSTNGMVLFYHYCQHDQVMIYSMIIDATQDQCQKNAATELHKHHTHADDVCNSCHSEEPECCTDHKTQTKTVKLKNEYNFSDRQDTPKPIWTKLVLAHIIPNFASPDCTLSNTESWRELPFEKPLAQPSGIQLVTLHCSFKIAC